MCCSEFLLDLGELSIGTREVTGGKRQRNTVKEPQFANPTLFFFSAEVLASGHIKHKGLTQSRLNSIKWTNKKPPEARETPTLLPHRLQRKQKQSPILTLQGESGFIKAH